jgi:hypothetical protein
MITRVSCKSLLRLRIPSSAFSAVTLLTTCFALINGHVRAQGTVALNNRVPGVVVTHVYAADICFAGNGTNDFPVGNTDWSKFTKLQGAHYFAQLLAAQGANAPDEQLMPANGVTTFRTGAAAGNVVPITVVLPNVPPDAPVATVRMVVWDNSSGLYPTWSQAVAGSTTFGMSPKINVHAIGGVANTTPNLQGLVSFNIGYLEGSGDPWIFVPPTSQIATAGSNATFAVSNSICGFYGAPNYGYQWLFQGSSIPGATASTLTITNVQTYHQGSYSVVVYAEPVPVFSPWHGTSNVSSSAILTVLPNPIAPQLKTGLGYGGINANGFSFTLFGLPQMVYRIQTSSNLFQWSDAFTVTNGNSSVSVTDSNVSGLPIKYYRAAQ